MRMKFVQFLCLRSKYFRFLANYLEKKRDKYISHDIQNEFDIAIKSLDILAKTRKNKLEETLIRLLFPLVQCRGQYCDRSSDAGKKLYCCYQKVGKNTQNLLQPFDIVTR